VYASNRISVTFFRLGETEKARYLIRPYF